MTDFHFFIWSANGRTKEIRVLLTSDNDVLHLHFIHGLISFPSIADKLFGGGSGARVDDPQINERFHAGPSRWSSINRSA